MKQSKIHFESVTVYNDDTIRRMFRTEYYVYETARRMLRLAVACGAILAGVFAPIPQAAKILCLLVGAWLIAAQDFPSKVQAEGVIAQRQGQTSKVKCRFSENGVEVENGLRIPYSQIDRLAEDEEYLYIFRDKQTAVMIPREGLVPKNPERLQALIQKRSGKQWEKIGRSILTLNLWDLVDMIRSRAGRKKKD